MPGSRELRFNLTRRRYAGLFFRLRRSISRNRTIGLLVGRPAGPDRFGTPLQEKW